MPNMDYIHTVQNHIAYSRTFEFQNLNLRPTSSIDSESEMEGDGTESILDSKVVAVAVNMGKICHAALKWGIENLTVGGGSVLLLHVRAKAQAFDPKLTNPHFVLAYSGIDVLNGLQDGYKEALARPACKGESSFPYCRKSSSVNDPLGKRLNNTKTREELGWEPKYRSFAEFLGVAE